MGVVHVDALVGHEGRAAVQFVLVVNVKFPVTYAVPSAVTLDILVFICLPLNIFGDSNIPYSPISPSCLGYL